MIIQLPGVAYVTELKYLPTPEQLEAALAEGMEQIKRKRYYQREMEKGRKVWLLALAITQGQISYRGELYA